MQSKAKTVDDYIQELPHERKPIISALRKAIKKNLPKGFEEMMSYGMIGYVVSHTLFPAGYHCDPTLPLPFINLASQKNHIAFYHMAMNKANLVDWFQDRWNEISKKKLDIGQSCIRFRKPEDVPVELIGESASKLTPQQWIDIYVKFIDTRK